MKTQLTKLAFILIMFSVGCDLHLNTTTYKDTKTILSILHYGNIANLIYRTGLNIDGNKNYKTGIRANISAEGFLDNSYKDIIDSVDLTNCDIKSLSGKFASGKPPLSISPPGDLITYKSSSNKLTPEMLAAIEKATPGTKVYFENIKAVGPDGKTRYLTPITLILKQ